MNIEINNGVVTKDGDEIGVIQDSTCYLTAQVGPTVKGAIKKTAGVELSFVVGNAPDAPDAPTTCRKACGCAEAHRSPRSCSLSRARATAA